MKILAIVAAMVLLIVAGVVFALVAFVALLGSSMDADTRLAAAILLVVALSAGVVADMLLIVGLRQPATRQPARPSRAAGDVSVRSSPPRGVPPATGTDAWRADPAPAPDHPGIAAMLVHPVSLRWEAAFIATLIDLAVRGYVDLAEQSGWLRCRAPSAPAPDPLTAGFERVLLDRVTDQLAAGDAPVQALLPDYQDEEGNQWLRRFESAVLDDAHRRGLTGNPQSRRIVWPFMSEVRSRSVDPTAVSRWQEMRDTLRTKSELLRLPERGAAVDDPALAWAVALGAAEDLLTTLLPPAPWSSFGGRWHAVPVPRSSKRTVPRWSLRRQRPEQRRTFTARVIRRWTTTDVSEYGSYTRRFVAVDDGRAEVAIVYRVGGDQFGRTRHDGDVLVTVDDKGRLIHLTPIGPLNPTGLARVRTVTSSYPLPPVSTTPVRAGLLPASGVVVPSAPAARRLTTQCAAPQRSQHYVNIGMLTTMIIIDLILWVMALAYATLPLKVQPTVVADYVGWAVLFVVMEVMLTWRIWRRSPVSHASRASAVVVFVVALTLAVALAASVTGSALNSLPPCRPATNQSSASVLMLCPDSGTAGTRVHVLGFGFADSETIELMVDSQTVATAKATSDGRLDALVDIPRSGSSGSLVPSRCQDSIVVSVQAEGASNVGSAPFRIKGC